MPEFIHTHTLTLGQLEAEVLRLLWHSFTEESNGSPPASAYYKYSQYRIRQKINESYAKIAALSGYLKSFFIVTLKDNYSLYQVPQNVVDITEVLYFTGATTYTPLKIRDEGALEDECPGWRFQSGTPSYAYPGNWNKLNKLLGVTPTPTSDGTAITLDSSIKQLYAAYGSVEGVEGSAGISSSGSTYVDAGGQNFEELGVIVGNVILNLTDSSRGTITALSTTNSTYDTIACSGGLAGGSVNTWTAGDEMQIIGGEYSPIITATGTETQFLLASNPGKLGVAGVTMATGNLLVICKILPIKLRTSLQLPELSPAFHQIIALDAAAGIGRTEPVSSPEFAQAKAYQEEAMTGLGTLIGTTKEQYLGKNIYLTSKR